MIKPKEITIDSDNGFEYASFGYYDGIHLAEKNNLKQTTSFGELKEDENFIVCCGDVIIKVKSDYCSEIERRII